MYVSLLRPSMLLLSRISFFLAICLLPLALFAQNDPTTSSQEFPKDSAESINPRAESAYITAIRALERSNSVNQRFTDFKGFFDMIAIVTGILVAIVAIFEVIRRINEQHRFKDLFARQRDIDEIQLQLSQKNLDSFDVGFESQISNFSKLGEVIGLVQQTFDIQIKAASKQEELQDQVRTLTLFFEKQKKKNERRFIEISNHVLPLRERTRLEWPKINLAVQNTIGTAVGRLHTIDEVMLLEDYEEPLEVAQVYYLTGVGAFYRNDISSALEFLNKAHKIYRDHRGNGSFEQKEHQYPYAFTHHFLGLIEKNWHVVNTPPLSNIRKAKEYLEEAQERLKDKDGEFLTPLTYAEVLSYLPDEREKAAKIVTGLVNTYEPQVESDDLDNNQVKLLGRAYLLLGNLHYLQDDHELALSWFEKANSLNPNVYALFSMGMLKMNKAPDQGRRDLADGFTRLKESGSLNKPEITNLGMLLAWASIASVKIGHKEADEYYQRFLTTMQNAHQIGHRKPLFFCPISKMPVPAARLIKTVEKQRAKKGNES